MIELLPNLIVIPLVFALIRSCLPELNPNLTFGPSDSAVWHQINKDG